MKEFLELDTLNDLARQTTEYVIDIQFRKRWRFADGSISRFSNSVWTASREYRSTMDTILRDSLRNGRDVVDIAKDMDVYVKGGKTSLAQRYAGLEEGTPDFINRIPQNVDYRSLRLSRTVIQGATQDAQIASYEINPGAKGFKWVLSPAHVRYSVCEDIVMGNPWNYQTFSFGNPPHPNCLSHAEVILETRANFNKQIRAWESNPTAPIAEPINSWWGQYYNPVDMGNKIELNRLLDRNLQAAGLPI